MAQEELGDRDRTVVSITFRNHDVMLLPRLHITYGLCSDGACSSMQFWFLKPLSWMSRNKPETAAGMSPPLIRPTSLTGRSAAVSSTMGDITPTIHKQPV